MARWISLWAAAVFCFSSVASGATTVTLKFHGPQSERVRLTRAEILLSGWGWADGKEVRASGDSLRLTLDPALTAPSGAKLADAESAFIYVEAVGFAPWRSDAFRWPSAEVFDAIHIVLDDAGRELVVRPNANVDVGIGLRKPIQRKITFLDEAGAPVAGLPVDISMFWSNDNHCGYFSGKRPLVASRTDMRGTIVVPDVDSEYGLELRDQFRARMEFVDSDTWRFQSVLRLSTAETFVRLHRFRRTPLRLSVLNKGVPVVGATLMVDLQLGVCGAGSGPEGVSDASGIISVPDFYPEEWPIAAICYEHKSLWDGSPTVDLPTTIDIATVTAESNYLCEP
jgi:hypothetical protein